MRKIVVILTLIVSVVSLFPEDEFFSDDTNFDDMNMDAFFGEDEDFIEEVEDSSDSVAETSELLTTDGVEWGGSFDSSIAIGVSYREYPSISGLFDHEKYEEIFTPKLDATLFFNSRPKKDVRYHGKFKTSLPFYDSATVDVYNEDYSQTPAEVEIPRLEVFELYTDFDYKSKVYFRIGKQNAEWGVGYFFSPADFLSVTAIDPEDPEVVREGPIAIKSSIPFGLNSISMFISVPEDIFSKEDASVSDITLAPQLQMLLGDTEISSGLFFQKDLSPKAMIAATYSTNKSIGKLSFFGEAVGMYGSDKKRINGIYNYESRSEETIFSGTIGFSWSKQLKENDFSFSGQYLYNGEGYSKNDQAIGLIEEEFSKTAEDNFFIGEVITGDLKANDLLNRNRHYIAANFGISDLFKNEDLSFSAFTMMNLVDISGFVKPTLSYEFFDYASADLSVSFNLSDEGEEYFADRVAYEIKFNLGSGNF